MLKKTTSVLLSILQILLVFTVLGGVSNVSAQGNISYEIGSDNSLLMPKYEKAQVSAYTDTPDWLKTAIINQIRLEAATAEGTLSAAEDLLPFYEQLGINCLMVNPINEKGTGVSEPNGYHNNGLHTIDLDLTEAENFEDGWANFARFVEKAHNHNIRIILDVIYWGVDKNAPMVNDAAYSGVIGGVNTTWNGYSYDYTSSAFMNYYTNTMLDIIDKTQIDGLRVDLAPTPTNCSKIFNGIRKKAFDAGNAIVIMSEADSNDRTGEQSGKTWDLEQVGVFDYVNRDYWDESWLANNNLTSEKNWVVNVHQPASFWLTTAENRDIVTTTKNGKVYSGNANQQKNSGTFLESYYGSVGENQYYTYAVSYHDVDHNKGNSVLDYGYSALFAPVIPLWMAGDEVGSKYGNGVSGALYFKSLISPELVSVSSQSEFYTKLKKYIEIRRKYSDIFAYFPENHKQTNICKVNVSGISTYQAYARYANGKAVLIIPNGTSADTEITVTIPVADIGVSNGYSVKNLMTDASITETNDTFTVNVKTNDIAVILVDDGTVETTGCENTVSENKQVINLKKAGNVGTVEEKIDAIGDVDINSVRYIERAESAYNSLANDEKLKVSNYNILKEARRQYNLISLNGESACAGYLTDDNFIPNSKTKDKWAWTDDKITFGQNTDGSYKIKYNTALPKDYRFEITKAVNLDGAHINIDINKGSTYASNMFYLRISPNHFNNTESGAIGIKLDCNANSQLYFKANGSTCDHSSMKGYNSAYPDRVFYKMESNIDLKFKFADDGGLIITVNGTDFKIKASDMANAPDLLTDNVVFYITTVDNSYPDLDINYLHSGEVECNDEVAKTGDYLYEVNEDFLLPDFNSSNYASWNNVITKTETENGLKVSYTPNINHSTKFRLTTRIPFAIDNLHIKASFNDTTYYSKVLLITLSNDKSEDGEGLMLKIDSGGGQLFAYLGNTSNVLNTSGYVTTQPSFTDRIFDPAIKSDKVDILLQNRNDGGLNVIVNGYVFPISAENMANIPGLTDLSKIYVGFSSMGSWPDYTLNFIHGGDELCYECELGDVNCDHDINIIDLVALKKLVINFEERYSADLNSDSVINSQDIVKLRKKLLESF